MLSTSAQAQPSFTLQPLPKQINLRVANPVVPAEVPDSLVVHVEEKQNLQDTATSVLNRGKSTSLKIKDLSHVPCKFYKVGSCPAGSSCPFSHSLVEPGGQKDVCSWFVKGNCKFGHKCAFPHVLPGQPMAMDRKNKKAAQIAAGGAQNHDGGGKGRGAPYPPNGPPIGYMPRSA